MNVSDFRLEKNDALFLFCVLLFSLFTVYKMIEVFMYFGIYDPDKAIYLIDALKFAGLDFFNICLPSDIYYSPVICFLTSVLFRFGIVDKFALFVVTGVFGVLCELGIYILFRQRFNQILSLAGVVIFGSFSVVLLNIGSGGIDIPSITFSVWIMLFTVVATERNKKYFLIIFPLLILGFFTRYTVGFMLPVILLYYVLSKDICKNLHYLINNKRLFKEKLIKFIHSTEFKYILISIFLGLIIAVIICWFIIDNGGSLTFFQQSADTFNGIKDNPKRVDFNTSRLFYLKNLFKIMFEDSRFLNSALSYLLLSVFGFGFLLTIKNYLNVPRKILTEDNSQRLIFKSFYILSLIGIIFGFVFLKNHMLSNICVIINMICLYCLIGDEKFNTKLSITIFSWLAITFIFASLYNVKVVRYFIPVLIPFVYIIILGLERILIELLNLNNKLVREEICYSLKSNINILPVILILLLVSSTFIFVNDTVYDDFGDVGLGLEDVTDYIIHHDNDYHSKEIIGDEHLFTIAKWYLNVNGTMLRDYEIDSVDTLNDSYAIISSERDFENYHEIYNSKGIYLYSHN